MEQTILGPTLYEIPHTGHPERSVIPPLRELSRPHLVRQVEDGMSGRLVLITAPAGWGKSSVLAEWASVTSLPVAWVDCARYGETSTRLVKGIVVALETVCPDFGKDLYAMLRSPRPLPAPQLFSVLADALEDVGENVALVLDDFHAILEVDAVDAVSGLVSTGPRNLRVVIGSRISLTWPLARMRVAGEVTEIGPRELAFTDDEVLAVLGGNTIPRHVATAVRERSGGWAAGIQLARLWMRHNPDPDHLVSLFDGDHRDIGDYLAEEVMAQIPPNVQRFLYTTSLVDRFSVGLAEAMLGSGEAADHLRIVQGHELFLVPDDSAGRWYRYHDVFREFLRSRAGDFLDDSREELLARAASWYQQEGHGFEAAACFLAAGWVDDAARILDDCAQDLVLRLGASAELIGLAERLPGNVLAMHLSLQRFYAWALVLVGRLDDAERIAGDIDLRAGSGDHDAGRFARAEAASIRARVAAYRGDHDATIGFGLSALECGDEDMDWFRADALLSIGFAYRAMGQISKACDTFGRASELGWSSRFANAALWGSRYQALTFVSRGQLEDATSQIERDMERAHDAGMARGVAYAALLVGRGELRYERNDLPGARDDLTAALALAREAGDAKILMNVHVALAMLEAAEGNVKGARDAARSAVRVFDGTSEKAVEARLALLNGDLLRVRRWMESYVEAVGDAPSLQRGEVEQVMVGRALLASRRRQEARSFLTTLLREAEASDRAGTALMIRSVLAQVEDEDGNPELANDYARQVIDFAMRERYVRSILDEGPRFLEIVRRALRHDPSLGRREYARSILSLTGASRSPVPIPGQGGVAEPLTPRQEEVLRLLVDGLSNREIAEELYLAEGTVKAHMNQIFTRLMVRNRTEAIRAAQRLGIGS